MLGGRDNYRGGNDGPCVTTPLAAHATQRKEHKQYEADHNRNENVHCEGGGGGKRRSSSSGPDEIELEQSTR